MSYFIVGFLLGLAAGLFSYRFKPGGSFSQVLQKEVDLKDCLVQIDRTGRRMDSLEERCCSLERKLPGAAREKGFSEVDLVGRRGTGRKPEQVLTLWAEGRELSDIVRRTGLSRGEIELIVSLQERH